MDFHRQPEALKRELESHELATTTADLLLPQGSVCTALGTKEDSREQDTEEASLRSGSESDGAGSRAAWCVSHRTYDTGNRQQFERFKKFIKGTPGERYWWLWMDIERLKALKDTTRQQRYFPSCNSCSHCFSTCSPAGSVQAWGFQNKW